MKSLIKLTVVFLLLLTACDNPLQEQTFGTLGPTNFYNNASDAEALLNSVYGATLDQRDHMRNGVTFNELTTDIGIQREGGINAHSQPVEDFVWSTNHDWLDDFWTRRYQAIFNANNLLDHVPDIDMDSQQKERILGEARFLRALNYLWLYEMFGPAPLLETSETSVTDRPSRASEEEHIRFLEDEFIAASEMLPLSQEQWGRPTEGAALGFLTRLYLNNREWESAAATAQIIIDSQQYAIFDSGDRTDLFALENQGNSEFIFVQNSPTSSDRMGHNWIGHAAPPGYQWKYPPKVNYAAQFKIRSEFLELFEPEDQRLGAFVFEYVHQNGDTIQLGHDDVRSFKYPEDPNPGAPSRNRNDIPLLRYADVLLARAEALNELNGPNPESIELVNEIREAAGVDPITLSDYSSTERLRDFILDERGREFHTEMLRRQDLIRHGQFIEMAIERGKPAAEHQVRFPIPQSEIDRNPNLEQNPGY